MPAILKNLTKSNHGQNAVGSARYRQTWADVAGEEPLVKEALVHGSRKVGMRLPEKGDSKSHGARPVY